MSFQRPTVDLFQGQWVLLVLWVLLMWMGMMVVVCGWSQMVTVMLLLLLSVLRVMFATRPLLLFTRYHPSIG